MYMQVGKLKRKLSEKRQQRPKSSSLRSASGSKLSSSISPETRRSGRRRRGQGSKVVVTMEHWRHALEQVTPSVSNKEKAKYQRM